MSLAIERIPLDTEQQIRDAYGDMFCKRIGIEHLLKMTRVSAESLNLHRQGKYHENDTTVAMMGDHSAVKGIDGSNRPFVALKVQFYDARRYTLVEMVEVLYKRCSLTGDGGKGELHENTFVSALSNMCSDGQSRESVIYRTGITHDWSGLQRLMEGHLVTTSLMKYSGGFIKSTMHPWPPIFRRNS